MPRLKRFKQSHTKTTLCDTYIPDYMGLSGLQLLTWNLDIGRWSLIKSQKEPTTFITPFGWFFFNRFPMGGKCAKDEFQTAQCLKALATSKMFYRYQTIPLCMGLRKMVVTMMLHLVNFLKELGKRTVSSILINWRCRPLKYSSLGI